MILVHDDDQVPAVPSDEETALAGLLGQAGLQAVDDAIVMATNRRWLKVARIVYVAAKAGGFRPSDDNHVCLHVRRVIALVHAGVLESEGNLLRPRFSEVRLLASGR